MLPLAGRRILKSRRALSHNAQAITLRKSAMAKLARYRYSVATNGCIETHPRIMNRLFKLLVGVCVVLVASFVLLHLGTDRHPRAIAVNEPPMECEDTPDIANDCVNDNDDDTSADPAPELTPPNTQG